MLRKTVLALAPLIAVSSIIFGGSVALAETDSNASTTDLPVLGNTNVETTTDSNGSQPQAWQYTASTSGSVTDIEAYDAGGTASLTVALYSDSSGSPGELLAIGSINKTKADAWNDITVGSASITAGTKYWLIWQGTDSFRDDETSNCTTVGRYSSIGNIGSSWEAGWTASGFCPASLYAAGTASVASAPPTSPAPVAPSNTTAPSITGTPQQGDTLTASPGSWSGDTPISFAYRWSDGTTGQTDTLGAADVGATVSVTVTASNDAGNSSATSATVGPVTAPAPPPPTSPAPVAPSNTTVPSITGTPQQGDTLTASPGSWSGDTPISFAYRWSDGTTGQTDTLGAADVRHRVSVTVTASNDAGNSSATSARVGPVTAPAPPPPTPPAPVAPSNTTVPSITGTPQQGDTLTASPGSWSGDTPISFAYRWSDGTTGQTDTLGAADVGETVSVTVTASNDAGNSSATSATVGPVTAPASPPPTLVPPTDTKAPAISGTAQVGDTLTVTNGTWTGDTPIAFSVKWSDGTTGASDTLTSADVGQTITATVTASNDAGSASATSAGVGPVAAISDDTSGIDCAPAAADTMTNDVSHRCGFADTTNSGVPAGTQLVNIPGQITAPTAQTGSGWTYTASNRTVTLNAGGVIKNVILTGGVNVVGANATVEDSDITCPGADCYAVQLRSATNAVVTHNNLHGSSATTGDGCDDAVRDISNNTDNVTITDNNIWWCAAPINNVAEGGLIQGNYIHDFALAAADNHLDGIQLEPGDGDSMTVQDNTILMNSDQTSPIILSNDGGGTETNRTVTHNLLAGGDYCFYGSASVDAKATGITFTNNDLSRMYFSNCGFFGALANIQSGTVVSGNIWDDTGQPAS